MAKTARQGSEMESMDAITSTPTAWFVPAASSGILGDVLAPLGLLLAALGAAGQAVLLVAAAALRIAGLLVPSAAVRFCAPRCFRLVYNMYFTNGCGSFLHRAIVSLSRGGNGPLRGAHLRVLRPTRLYRRAATGQLQGGTGAAPLPFATVWPVPLLEDNMAYIIVDHATGLAAAVDVCAAVPGDLARADHAPASRPQRGQH